jgi:hypothetical protein
MGKAPSPEQSTVRPSLAATGGPVHPSAGKGPLNVVEGSALGKDRTTVLLAFASPPPGLVVSRYQTLRAEEGADW